MADTSLGRASLSVTADLSSFTSAMDSAASKTSGFNKANNLAADSTRKLMDATDKANKINAGGGQKSKGASSSGGMKITDMLGIGFFTSAFSKIFDGAINLVTKITSSVIDLGAKVIESGSKFQELDHRLKAMTGFKGIAKGLQDIMKTGPSASFTALGEAATRLAGMKFRPDAIAGLIKDFNRLGVALGNPEKIVALITDKIADMATNGGADMASLGKLADEQIPVFEALAKRMGVSIDEAKRRVAAGLVTVAEATQAIADAANMPQIAAAAAESANSFSGIWSRVANNIEVVFQNVGASILKGFGLVTMGETITEFFKEIEIKILDLAPMLEKIGEFAADVTKMIMDEISSFLSGWKTFTDDTSAETMLSSMSNMSRELVDLLREVVKAIISASVEAAKAAKNISWWTNIDLINNPVADLFKQIVVSTGEFVLNVGEWSDGIETIGGAANNAADGVNNLANAFDLAAQNAQNLADTDMSGAGGGFGPDDINDMMQPASNGGGTWLTALEEEMQSAEMELADFDKQWQKLHDEVQKPIHVGEAGWKKFFADNITPMQQYESEVAKLRGMMDGSKEGAMAFALGSANAIKKLKEATGLGGPQQFASAVQAGSAEAFQVKIDEMGKAKNVQEEIRQLMEAAAEVEAQQLQAAKDIAAAIEALPAQMPRAQQIAVAVNP